MDSENQRMDESPRDMALPARLGVRGLIGGVLMGLANLVPGISGGTMLVAAGIYRRFIAAVAEVSTLRFRLPSLVLLGAVVAGAGGAVVGLAGPVKDLVVYHRWIMYSLFIGLTLGGVPVVWQMVNGSDKSVWAGAVCGFAGMTALALAQSMGAGGAGAVHSVPVFLVAGMLGASAMILPGVSGGYLMLVIGVYVPVLSAVDAAKGALGARDWSALADPGLRVLLPVGIGVLVGIVAVSNLLKILLRKYEKPTLGVLLGLLVGAVVGLWPFQQGVEPEIGDTFKGRTVTPELKAEIDPDDYPTAYFQPELWQIPSALGLIAAGFAATALIAKFGKEKTSQPDEAEPRDTMSA
jgi:putative membrane protein